MDLKLETDWKSERVVYIAEPLNRFGVEVDYTLTVSNPDEFFSAWDVDDLQLMLNTQLQNQNYEVAEIIQKNIELKQKPKLKLMYNLSKNYDELYTKHILCGHIIVCFVDYIIRNSERTLVDICQIRIKTDGVIDFGVRGICYGDVTPTQMKEENKSMKKLFIEECERLNVQWILP